MRLAPVALACALLLSGCAQAGGAMPTPTPSVGVDAVRTLADGFWSVSGADEPSSTRVRFGPRSVDLFRTRGAVYGDLATRGDHLLASVWGWSMSLGDDHAAPWLEAAATLEPAGDGVRLVGTDGRTVAVLHRADAPAPSKEYETDPTPPAGGDPAPSATPAPAAATATARALAGRWRLAGTDAAIVLGADGDWRAITSCPSGTGGAGGAGRFRVLADRTLLLTEGPIAGVGCSEPSTPPSADAPAVRDFAQAGSLRLEGDRLTVFDRTGAPLGTLVR